VTRARRRAAPVALLALVVVAGAGACQRGHAARDRGAGAPGPASGRSPGTDAPPADDALADRPFDEGSKATRDRVAEALARLPVVDGPAFAEAVRTLVGAGDPAIPPLLRTLTEGDPRARARAAYVLGFFHDRRTLPALAAAAATDADATVRSDAGASLLEMGDDRGFPPLVDALDDVDARRRVRAIDALAAAAGGTRLGYEADGPPEERIAAVARWRAFLARRRAELESGDAVPLDAPAPDEVPRDLVPPDDRVADATARDGAAPSDLTPGDPKPADARPGSRPPRDGRDRRPKRP